MTTSPNTQAAQESEELAKAGLRIMEQRSLYGGARAASLAWALAFFQEDAERYSFGECCDRWWEVRRFALDGGVGPEDRLTGMDRVRHRLPGRLASPVDEIRPYPGPGDRDMLATLQGAGLAGIREYVRTGRATTGTIPLNFTITKDRRGVLVNGDTPFAFEYQLIHLLDALGSRVKQCRRCKRMFLAGRSDKEFCSGTCQALTWKQEHPTPSPKRSAKKGGTHGTKKGR